MAEIPAETAAAAVGMAIAAPVETETPAVIPTIPAEVEIPVATLIPAAHETVPKKADAAVWTETEIADRPDRISLILHRWMILHFPEEMTEDVRPADVSRILKNKEPLSLLSAQGFFLSVGRINWT